MLDSEPSIQRLQRITLADPNGVRFTRLLDGSLSVNVRQRSGIHNVLVYVWRGQSMFLQETAVHAPGVDDMHFISNESRLVMVLAVKRTPNEITPHNSIRLFEAQFIGLLQHFL